MVTTMGVVLNTHAEQTPRWSLTLRVADLSLPHSVRDRLWAAVVFTGTPFLRLPKSLLLLACGEFLDLVKCIFCNYYDDL